MTTDAVSAKGLFRSTGKRRRARPVVLEDGSYAMSDERMRATDDFEPTPPEPTFAIMAAERPYLERFDTIWEPACGDGRMARDIETCGHRVVSSDLRDRGCGAIIKDFFAFTEPLSRCIVTNPPYNMVNARDGEGRWIWHAIDTLKVDYMALLLSWNWPGAGSHAKLWHTHTPSVVYLCRWKIDFSGEGAPPMLNAWFVWDRNRTPPSPGVTQLAMLDRIDGRQRNLDF